MFRSLIALVSVSMFGMSEMLLVVVVCGTFVGTYGSVAGAPAGMAPVVVGAVGAAPPGFQIPVVGVIPYGFQPADPVAGTTGAPYPYGITR